MRVGQTEERRRQERLFGRLHRTSDNCVGLEISPDPTRPHGAVGEPKLFCLHSQPSTSSGCSTNQQRAFEVSSQRSADSTSVSFHRFSCNCIMQVGENLRLCLDTRKIKSHANPPLFGLHSVEGPSGRARREIIIFGRGYCYFFFGSHCCSYYQETGGGEVLLF